MNETLAPTAPAAKKRGKWLFALLCLLAISGVWLSFFLGAERQKGTRYRLVSLGQGSSARAGPIPIELAPELVEEGMTIEYLSTAADVSQVAFVRKESHSVKLRLNAGRGEVAKDGLAYTLYGSNGEELSQGKVRLDSPVGAGESVNGEVGDVEIANTGRIVIHK